MNTDHNLWKIVQNGNNKKSLGRDSKGGIIILPPVSFEEHVAVQRETKARTLLLQSLHEDHMADFHHMDDAREIWLAVKARFGGNKESKKIRKTMHEAENKTEEGEQVYHLMAGIKSDFADHAGNAAGSVYDVAAEFSMMGISPKAKIENKDWEVKLKESLARTKLGLGFKESIGSDEVFDLSTPSVFDPEPKNKEVKSLYKRFVKAGEMHEVPSSITGTFLPTSYKSDLEETQVTFGLKSNTFSINTFESNDFISCDNNDKSSESETWNFASCVSRPKTNDSFSIIDIKILPKSDVKDPSPTNSFPSCSFKENVKPPKNLCNKSGIADRIHCKNNFARTKTCFFCGSKSHLIKDCDVYDNVDNFLFVVSKAAYVPVGSRNSSASISTGRSIPATSRNRPASIHAGRHIPTGREDGVLLLNPQQVHPYVNKDICIVDSGCSRSMTGNKEKLDDFVQVKGGIVTFGGGDGKITGKGTIRTSKLKFENVYYVEELQHFNLFSVLQICDKKNKVIFTDDECLDFIALIENQLNKKVKAIRYDNGTEFRNEKLIDLYRKKGSKRDYSNSRTPQQNGVAKRNNRTLIEAARSMLADSKLPTMFWTEAVSTACYVLNRVSITNPHKKTPYELLSRKVPNISHLKPFGCQVTILNTSDHLGKFKGKANECFLVGYAANSYTRFKNNTPAGTQDTNINAGRQYDDSESDCDEQTNLVPFFPSNSFSGPKVNEVSATIKNHLDYAKELARLQRQEHEAHSAAEKYGFEFSNETAEMLHQAKIEAHRNLVLAARDPVGSIVSTGGVPAGSFPTSSVLASSVSSGGVLASSVDSAGFGDPPASEFVLVVFNLDHADNSTLPPGHSLGSSEHSTRFFSPSDLGNHQPNDGIFSSSSYDDDFYADVTNLASSVVVDSVASKRVAIGTKWILKNKRDTRGIVVRNKARLKAQGHRQEECINYDEVFAPVARIETIRLFLAFALYMGFMVYQMDVKSAFLYGEIEEEVKYKTAQGLWAAILKTFGGNEATKKMKKNLLKQQYGNFKAKGSETLEQTFNRP
uniref:Uncharacterized protein n=1 Tax=Tanacetum cinerariifolium TaxID=118510 RepID=A0A6L2K5J8_TANCI|nr:hypothetical protein [Tanacetum cinerariifolium]